jgi:hypothetical protein
MYPEEINARFAKLKTQTERFGERESTEAQIRLLNDFIEDIFNNYFTHEQREEFIISAEETMEGLQ